MPVKLSIANLPPNFPPGQIEEVFEHFKGFKAAAVYPDPRSRTSANQHDRGCRVRVGRDSRLRPGDG